MLRDPLLTRGPSIVVADASVPTCDDTVVTTQRAPRCPPIVRSIMADDDNHRDDSVSEPPTRTLTLVSSVTNADAPTTVTLTDPVLAPFVAIVELGSGPAAVATASNVPTCRPDVATQRRPVALLIVVLPRTLLSDVHKVLDNLLPPTRPTALYAKRPPPTRPTIVTLCDPVAPTFVPTTLLNTTPSVDTAASNVPTCRHVVDAIARPVHIADVVRSVIPLEDFHCVISEPLPPMREAPVPRCTT